MKYEKNNPFYDANNKNCYAYDYLENEKNQFIYMKEVIKIIYYLVYNHNIIKYILVILIFQNFLFLMLKYQIYFIF